MIKHALDILALIIEVVGVTTLVLVLGLLSVLICMLIVGPWEDV